MYHLKLRPAFPPPDSVRPLCARPMPPTARPSVAPRRRRISIAAVSGVMLLGGALLALLPGYRPPPPRDPPPPIAVQAAPPAARLLQKHEVQTLTAGVNLLNALDSRIEVRQGQSCYTLQTTLDPDLQRFLVERLDRRNSRYIGIVVMDPRDGRVLAMAGHDKFNPAGNPCLDSRFPAASVFKIITAAAAVETCDLEPESLLKFSGGKYTLYKSQVSQRPPKNANTITLRDSFAQSVNPVFGRLGADRLGKDVIEAYADAFGFNHEIDFELPLRPSRLELGGGPFEVAEIASGFNRTTRLSPVHGAVIAAAVLNRGRRVEPTLVDWVMNDAGRTVYQGRAVYRDQAIDRETAAVLRRLMQATVQSGTAHKEFQKYRSDRIMAQLEIGGKTGSIGDGSAAMRYDWFVGYATDRRGDGQLVFAVVVAHEDFIGTRAAAYAAMAIQHYFRGHLARLEPRPPAS